MITALNIRQDLGIESGTGLILLIVLYFVIKGAVKGGMISAFEEIAEDYGFKKVYPHEDITSDDDDESDP